MKHSFSLSQPASATPAVSLAPRFSVGYLLVVCAALPTIGAVVLARLGAGMKINSTYDPNALGIGLGQYTLLQSAWTSSANQALLALAFIIAVGVCLAGLPRKNLWNPWALIFIGVCFFGSILEFLRTGLLPDSRFNLLVVLLLAVLISNPQLSCMARAMADVGTFVVITSIFQYLANPNDSFVPCRMSKCGLLTDGLFLGSMNNENSLAMVIAVCLSAGLFVWRGKSRVILASAFLILILLSGSRSGMVAGTVAISMATALLVMPRSRPILGIGALLAAIVAMFPIFVTVQLEAFSGRGLLWTAAQDELWAHPLIPGGPTRWAEIVSEGTSVDVGAIYAPHNEWLDVGVAYGSLGVTLLFCFIVRVTAKPPMTAHPVLLGISATLISLFLTERPLALNRVDQLTMAFLALLAGSVTDTFLSGSHRANDDGSLLRRVND